MSKKIYDYTASQEVIGKAWDLATKYLKETLGEQYTYNVTGDALPKFYDCVEQDIKYLMQCPVCDNIDGEGNFVNSIFSPEVQICYDCYTEESFK